MSVFDDLSPEGRDEMEEAIWKALDLRLGGDLTRRLAEGVTPEERLEAIQEVDRIEEKVRELREEQDHTPPGLVDVEAVNEELIAWARRTGEAEEAP